MALRLTLSCFALIALSAGPAYAAMPSGPEVIEHLRAHAPAATPFVVNYVEDAPPGGVAKLAIRVAADGKGSARLDRYDLHSGATMTTLYASTTKSGVSPIKEAPLWLQWWTGVPIELLCEGAKIDTTRVSLAHAQGVVLWVLGAGPKDTQTPQLQVERKHGLLRGAVGADPARIMSSVKLDDYTDAGPGTLRLPKTMRIRAGEGELRMVKTWMQQGVDVQFQPEEFAPAKD